MTRAELFALILTDGTEKATDGASVEEELTRSVIGAFFDSYNKLGYGFLEKVCVGALAIELRRRRHSVEREVAVAVYYDEEIIGAYKADLVVDGKLLIEVKAEPSMTGVHERQLRNYLAATTYEIGIILVYGIEPKHKRMIHTRNLKRMVQNPWPFPSNPSDPCEQSLESLNAACQKPESSTALPSRCAPSPRRFR